MNIDSIKTKLLVKYPLFGSIVANVKFIEDSTIETTETDGKNIYYNPTFMQSLTSNEQVFILAHEICHIAFNHIFRAEGKDMELWNKATNTVINALLKQDGLTMAGVIDIEEAIFYDAEEMYNKLLSNQKNQTKNDTNLNKSSEIGDQKNQPSSTSFDTHSMWQEAIEKNHQKEKSINKEDGFLDKLNKMFHKKKKNENNEQLTKQKIQNEMIRELEALGEKEAFRQNKVERKRQLERLRDSLISKSHCCGNDLGGERLSVSNIGIYPPLIDWRVLLKEAISYDVDWSYQNALVEDGVVTAYLEEIPTPETEIVLDTSGSIDEILLRNFLRECKNILDFSKIKVGCFDTKFYGFTEIKNVTDIDSLSFYGGGGTDFNAVINAFSRRVENKIIFTDGCAPMPSTKIDAIWIVFNNKEIRPNGGRVIYINDENLKNLLQLEIIHEGKTR